MQPVLFILGSIASGADVIAEILRRLGVEMTGPDGRSTCRHAEDLRLAEIVLESIDPPRPGLDARHWFARRHDDAVITAVLRDYLRDRYEPGDGIIGCYNELLAALADQIHDVWANWRGAMLIHVVREPASHAWALRRRMPWLSDAQVNLLIDLTEAQSSTSGATVIVHYDRIAADPQSFVLELAESIGLNVETLGDPAALVDDELLAVIRGETTDTLTSPSRPPARRSSRRPEAFLPLSPDHTGACHD